MRDGDGLKRRTLFRPSVVVISCILAAALSTAAGRGSGADSPTGYEDMPATAPLAPALQLRWDASPNEDDWGSTGAGSFLFSDGDYVYVQAIHDPRASDGGRDLAVFPLATCPDPCTPSWRISPPDGSPSEVVFAGEQAIVSDPLEAYPQECGTSGGACAAVWRGPPGRYYASQAMTESRLVAMEGGKRGWRVVGFPLDCSGQCAPAWRSGGFGSQLHSYEGGRSSGDGWYFAEVDDTVIGVDGDCAPGRCPAFTKNFPEREGSHLVIYSWSTGKALMTLQTKRDPKASSTTLRGFRPRCRECPAAWSLRAPSFTGGVYLLASGEASYMYGDFGHDVGIAAYGRGDGHACTPQACSLLWKGRTTTPVSRLIRVGSGVVALGKAPHSNVLHVSFFPLDCEGMCDSTSELTVPLEGNAFEARGSGDMIVVSSGSSLTPLTCSSECQVGQTTVLPSTILSMLMVPGGIAVDVSGRLNLRVQVYSFAT